MNFNWILLLAGTKPILWDELSKSAQNIFKHFLSPLKASWDWTFHIDDLETKSSETEFKSEPINQTPALSIVTGFSNNHISPARTV